MRTIFEKIREIITNDRIMIRIVIASAIFINMFYLNLWLLNDLSTFSIYCWILFNSSCLTSILISLHNIRIEREVIVCNQLDEETRKLYLCGFNIRRYILTDAFARFNNWANDGHCWILSVICMFILEHNDTAKICKGIGFLPNSHETSIHYWVEFKAEGKEWIFDLSWGNGLLYKNRYYRVIKPKLKWTCDYEDFWKIDIVSQIYENMRKPETSYVLDFLFVLFWNRDENKGFSDEINECRLFRPTKRNNMAPIPTKGGSEIYWRDTLRDFVMNPKRRQPKARTQRIAKSAWNYVKEYYSK